MELERITDEQGKEKIGTPRKCSFNGSTNEMDHLDNFRDALGAITPEGVSGYKIINHKSHGFGPSFQVEMLVQFYK